MERHITPAGIERASMAAIAAELTARGVTLPPETETVVRRVIHATADFDFVEALRFTPHAVSHGVKAVRGGVIVTDTNMALAGLNRSAMARLGTQAHCLMAEAFIAEEARKKETTRAAVSMEWALERYPGAVFAVGNAPTALFRLAEGIDAGARPALIIGVPVGFVNVAESKERLWECCLRRRIPAIAAMGRKGGSGVAAAICNALLYTAADMLDPERRTGQPRIPS